MNAACTTVAIHRAAKCLQCTESQSEFLSPPRLSNALVRFDAAASGSRREPATFGSRK